ncbi:hypothetical protein HPB52_000532 [Rhipicephalus sanguineus]|uniref:Uncharacterized protein n=2 Tax=Rhipicephalus sanguineus TaxID=34632 RepID=A0A9D4T315_RHISA|nr:hypothetical protein HPB52_000532 [Rhipicephalus sanguineus]
MFSAEHMKKLRDSGGQWISDLSSVPQVTSDVIDNHFGESHRQLIKGWMFKEERYVRRIECTTQRQPTGLDLVVLHESGVLQARNNEWQKVVYLEPLVNHNAISRFK